MYIFKQNKKIIHNYMSITMYTRFLIATCIIFIHDVPILKTDSTVNVREKSRQPGGAGSSSSSTCQYGETGIHVRLLHGGHKQK